MTDHIEVLNRLRVERETMPDREQEAIVAALLAEVRQVAIAKAIGRSREQVRLVFKTWAEANSHRCSQHQGRGMTCGEFERLRARAGNRCECCGCAPEDTPWGYLVIDHDQQTGRIRGLVCQKCNSGLGKGDCYLKHPRDRGNRPHTKTELAYLATPPL